MPASAEPKMTLRPVLTLLYSAGAIAICIGLALVYLVDWRVAGWIVEVVGWAAVIGAMAAEAMLRWLAGRPVADEATVERE